MPSARVGKQEDGAAPDDEVATADVVKAGTETLLAEDVVAVEVAIVELSDESV